jgi:hypothetical protein
MPREKSVIVPITNGQGIQRNGQKNTALVHYQSCSRVSTFFASCERIALWAILAFFLLPCFCSSFLYQFNQIRGLFGLSRQFSIRGRAFVLFVRSTPTS